MVTFVLSVVLSQAQPTLVPSEAEAPNPALSSAPVTDAPASDARAKKFTGALIGGLLGVAGPLAVLGSVPSCTFPCISTNTTALIFAGFLMPILATVGTNVGMAIGGGEPSFGASMAGLLAGLAASAALVLSSFALGMNSWVPLAGSAALIVGLEVLALDARREAIARGDVEPVPARRFAATTLVTLGVEAGTALLTAFVIAVSAPVGLVLGGLGAVLMPLVAWGVHQANDGKGTLGAAYLGWAGAIGIGFAGVLLGVLGAIGGSAAALNLGTFAIGITAASVGAAFAMPLALQFSHGLEMKVGPALSIGPQGGSAGIVTQF